MAKATVEAKVTLELTIEEANVLYYLCGEVCENGKGRDITDAIYEALEKHEFLTPSCHLFSTCTINSRW